MTILSTPAVQSLKVTPVRSTDAPLTVRVSFLSPPSTIAMPPARTWAPLTVMPTVVPVNTSKNVRRSTPAIVPAEKSAPAVLILSAFPLPPLIDAPATKASALTLKTSLPPPPDSVSAPPGR